MEWGAGPGHPVTDNICRLPIGPSPLMKCAKEAGCLIESHGPVQGLDLVHGISETEGRETDRMGQMVQAGPAE